MTGFDTILLISQTYTTDELGQYVPNEAPREVFARVESVSQREFFAAAQTGLRPELKAILTFAEDYQGEQIAVWQGMRYAIYRTYATPSGQMELYLKRETGVSANGENHLN